MVISAMSRRGSYGILAKMSVLIASGPPRLMPMVVPSGSAFATRSVPMLPLAPGRFSITTGWPSIGCRLSATTRPTMSGVEPGPNGTISRSGFVGQSCAAAGAIAASEASRAKA